MPSRRPTTVSTEDHDDTTAETTIQEYSKKLLHVGDKFAAEFNMGESGENTNDGPAPNMKTRNLIFDSIKTIIDKGAKDNTGKGEKLARYVYVCGAGYNAQLGRKPARGQKKYANIPIPIQLENSIRQLSCGALHTAVVTDDGQLFTWGDCQYGQLGHIGNGYAMLPIPTEVYIEEGAVRTVACGQYHTVCVTLNDHVYSWGLGKYGALGLGDRHSHKTPLPVTVDDPGFKNIKQISCGDRHTCFVTEAGLMFTCGSGEHGQLGHSNYDPLYSPKSIESLKEYRVVQADCGSIHTACVTDTGKVFVWGFGEHLYGLGKPNFNDCPTQLEFKHKVVSVACGQSHILILTDNGDVYAWGGGEYGEIGQGAFKSQYKPVLVLVGKNIVSIACGRYHSGALSNMGILYTWGCGDNGQLGRAESNQDNFVKQAFSVPKVVNSLTGNVVGFVSCGEHHTCVIASCRYLELTDHMLEWGTLEEMEYEFKVNITSRHRGRGIPRKDINKIRRWRREEERTRQEKRDKEHSREEKVANRQVAKIVSGEACRDELLSPEKEKSDLIENMNDNCSVSRVSVFSRSTRKNTEFQIPEEPVNRRQRRKQERSVHVSSKQANQAHAGFHEHGTELLSEIGATVQNLRNPKIDGIQYSHQDMLKRKFSLRKKYDKEHLIAKQRARKLKKLKEEFEILQEADSFTEIDSNSAQETLHALEMKLNTVNIKITEAERNRKTYELNISNIKDESQENHKQLDIQRRQLTTQENLRKKICKFGQYAGSQKDLASGSIKEFKFELNDWKNFLRMILTSMTDLAKGKRENENKEMEFKKKRAADIKRNKCMKKIQELRAKVEEKEEEMAKYGETREEFEDEIEEYLTLFLKLKKATNKEDPDEIITKFELNSEIHQEYQEIRDHRLDVSTSLQEEKKILEEQFFQALSDKHDCTWMEVDVHSEKLQLTETKMQQKMSQVAQITTLLEQLKEWMTSIISKYDKYLSEWDGVDDRITQAKRDDIVAVLESLQSRIKTFRHIIQQNNNNSKPIFTKKEELSIPHLPPKAR